MQTSHIPALSANDADKRIVCPEGCAIWAGKASRPWWIYTGGISTCVILVLYEFNSPAPQVYLYHFLASGPLIADFNANLPARLGGGLGLFRARIYSDYRQRSARSIARITAIRNAIAGVNAITEADTHGGFNLRLSNGIFTDGVAGAGGMGHLRNPSAVVQEFFRMQDFGGLDVAKTLPGGW